MLGIVLAVFIAPAGVVEVREIEAVDFFILNQLEQFRQVVGVILGQREANADFQAKIPAQSNALERGFKSTVQTTEFIVSFTDAIKRNANVIEITLGDLADIVFVDQCTV